jgi:hypothetical protein
MTPQRVTLLVGGIAAAVALFLLVRPDDEDEPSAVATTVPTPTETSVTTTTAPPTTAVTTTAPEPQLTTVRVTVRGGVPVGGISRVSVDRGERVRIVVRADVADHVHLHGYDIMRDVAPGAPAQLVFTANLTGAFEVELEDRGLQIAEVAVGP